VVPNLRHHLSRVTILAQLTSDDVLDTAYEWLCRRRRDYSANSDVWSLRRCWQLRRAVKLVNQTLGALSLEKHPDKTFIGRIERGFDFLGYHFSPERLSVAKKTIENFIEKASRLYEQKRSAGSSVTALEVYVRQWLRWSRAGLESGRLISSTIIEDDALLACREQYLIKIFRQNLIKYLVRASSL
jgi:hypothetical protein